jgi:hypothetical protein
VSIFYGDQGSLDDDRVSLHGDHVSLYGGRASVVELFFVVIRFKLLW